MPTRCLCCQPCLLGTDSFNRANNADVNAGSPLLPLEYEIVAGTWLITSSQLTTSSAAAKLLFPVFPTAPTDARTYSVSWNGVGIPRFFVGKHFIEITPTAIDLYDSSDGARLFRRKNPFPPSAFNRQVKVAQGPNGLWYGIALTLDWSTMGGPATYSVFLPMGVEGQEFGVGTSPASSGSCAFDNLAISQNATIGTFADAGTCLSASSDPCLRASRDFNSVEWEKSDGSFIWNPSSTGGNITYPNGGWAKFVGGFGEYSPITVTRSQYHSTSFAINAWHELTAWIDFEVIGAKLTAVDSTRLATVEVYGLPGGLATFAFPITGWESDRFRVEVSASNDLLYVTAIVESQSTYDEASRVYPLPIPRLAVPGFSGASGHPNNPPLTGSLNVNKGVRSGFRGGPCFALYPQNLRGPYYGTPYFGCWRPFIDQDWCAGGPHQYDCVLDGVACSAGDASELNGVAFRTVSDYWSYRSAVVNCCDGRTNCSFAVMWLWIDAAKTTLRLTVFVMLNQAWARFQKDYPAGIACDAPAGTNIPLVAHENSGNFDLSAATLTLDAV